LYKPQVLKNLVWIRQGERKDNSKKVQNEGRSIGSSCRGNKNEEYAYIIWE
jgi:hypothetical protein